MTNQRSHWCELLTISVFVVGIESSILRPCFCMEHKEVVNTWSKNNRCIVLLNVNDFGRPNTEQKKTEQKKQEDEEYALRPIIYELGKLNFVRNGTKYELLLNFVNNNMARLTKAQDANNKLFDMPVSVSINLFGMSPSIIFDRHNAQLLRFRRGTKAKRLLYNETLNLAIGYLYQRIQNCMNEVNLNHNFLFSQEEKDDLTSEQSSSIVPVPAPNPEKKIIPAPSPRKIVKRKIVTVKSNGIPKNMTGLEWFGNHCYANAAFQFLFACHTIRNFIKDYSGENDFLWAVQELFCAMADNGGNIIKSPGSGGNIGLKTLYSNIGRAAKNSSLAYGCTIRELGSSSDQKDAYELL
ncbi:MAG: ubiquitin carboxyl-terminal hydrolase, partial [Holosporaceae bacterium]|nr:ubiquitin carboxyl-terminal hydrolase [Holosporaceae bacterium]